MNSLVIFGLVLIFGLAYARPDDKYTTKYDNVDLDSIIKNDRLMRNYLDCLLDKGKCSKDGLELKKHIPDALTSDCSKCSEAQKAGSKKMIRHLIKNRRDWWNELEAKFDPTGSYKNRYADELRREGIVL